MEVEAESKGTRSNPARGQRRAARWPSAAAPRPELIFSFGLCQIVQGAKEDEGTRPTRGSGRLRASGLLRELRLRGIPFLGVISTGLVLVQQGDVC